MSQKDVIPNARRAAAVTCLVSIVHRKRGAQVVHLRLEPRRLYGVERLRWRARDQGKTPVAVAFANRERFACLLESLEAVLPNGFEHVEARVLVSGVRNEERVARKAVEQVDDLPQADIPRRNTPV